MIADEDLVRLERIAEVYKVTLRNVGDSEDFSRDNMLNGPAGTAGLDLERRAVHFSRSANFEHVLHEVMHIVVHPPGLPIEDVPEELVLLQFERALSRTLPRHLREPIRTWQNGTRAYLIGPQDESPWLEEIADYEHHPTWRRGFHLARELGLLHDLRPTWKLPTWTPALLEEASLAAAAVRETRRLKKDRDAS